MPHFTRQASGLPSVDALRLAVPGLDTVTAHRALSALRALVHSELATVYSPAGSHGTRYNVWLEVSWRRLTLAEWVAEWLAAQEPSGGDAA